MLPMPGSPTAQQHGASSAASCIRARTRRSAPKAFEQLARVLPGAVQLRTPLPAASSVYATLFHRLIVLGRLAAGRSRAAGLGAGPAGTQQARQRAGRLARVALGRPDGDHPAGLPHRGRRCDEKRQPRRAGPRDVPFDLRLMSTGARTILLSRWRTGGQTSRDAGARVRPRIAAHGRARGVAAGGHGHGRHAARPGAGAAAESHRVRGPRPRRIIRFSGRATC